MRWQGAGPVAALLAAVLLGAPAAAVGQDDALAGLDAVQSEGLAGVQGAQVFWAVEDGVEGVFEGLKAVAEEKKEDLGDGYDPLLSALDQSASSLAHGLSRMQDGLGQAGGALNGGSGLPQGPLASSVNPLPSFSSGF